jgi:hypothetical protein
VWLLGAGLHDDQRIRQVLNGLQKHMLEPNSLILAAETVRNARTELVTKVSPIAQVQDAVARRPPALRDGNSPAGDAA